MRTWKADLALLGNTVIWGVTFVLVKDALHDVSPLVYLALRFTLAAIVLGLVYGRKLKRASLRDGAIAGVFLFLGYLFQTTGLQYTSPSKSAFYTSLSIPMVPLLASLVYRSAPKWMEVAGIVVGTGGMLLLTTEGSRIVWDRGSLLSLLCAVAFAGHIVAVGYFAERSSFETIAVMQVTTAALLAVVRTTAANDPAAALAMIAAYEVQAADIAASKGDGLRRHYGFDEEGTRFWDVHRTQEVDHAGWSLPSLTSNSACSVSVRVMVMSVMDR